MIQDKELEHHSTNDGGKNRVVTLSEGPLISSFRPYKLETSLWMNGL